jgi:hypothetical protein
MKKVICALSILLLCVSFSNCSGVSNPVQGKTFVVEEADAMLERSYSSTELGSLFDGLLEGLFEAFGFGSLSEILSSIELEFQKEVFHFRSPIFKVTTSYQIRDNYIFVDEGGKNAMTFKIINPNKLELVVESMVLDNFIFVAK